MQHVVSVLIDRPIDEVFRFTTDHLAEWSITVIEDEAIEKKPEGVGTTFRVVTENNGQRMNFQGVVTRDDPPHARAIRMTNDMLDIETEFTFENLSGQTRVTQTANVTGKGFFRLLIFVFGSLMQKSSCKA